MDSIRSCNAYKYIGIISSKIFVNVSSHIRIMSDSTTVVCYINDMGGSKSIGCDRLSKAIWYLVLVIPLWPTQTYFTSVLNLLIETPRIFKTSRMTLVHPVWTSPHPLHQSLVLMVCKLSGIPCMSATFRRRLPIPLCSPGEILHTNSTEFGNV